MKTLTVSGTSFRAFPLPPPAPPVAWGFAGPHLILAVGEGMPETIVAGLANGGGLAQHAPFRSLREKVSVERPVSRLYLDLAQVVGKVTAVAGPYAGNIIDALGLNGVSAVISEGGLEGEGFATKSFVATRGVPAGLLRLAEGNPLGDGDLAVIPKDSTVAFAFRLNAEAIYREILTVVGRIDPQTREEFVREIEGGLREEMGFRLVEDILAPLGDAWTVWSSPAQGGLLFTGLTAAVTLKDRNQAEASLEKFVGWVKEQTGPRIRPGSRRIRRDVYIESFTFKGTKIYYVNVVGEEFPLAPA